MRINQNIYNHLSSSLVPKKRNVTHKSSELRAIYNKMAKYNKHSPLYLLSLSEQKQSYMINIKEAAITLKDVAESFANPDSDIYHKRSLKSSDNDAVSGALKSSNYNDIPDSLEVKIVSLATEQVNTGSYIASDGHSFNSGDYRFSINTLGETAHFNVQINRESNIEVQHKIAQYINTRSLGIAASVVTNGNKSALIVNSSETGRPSNSDGLYFTFRADGENDIVDMLKLNDVSTPPSNSEFYINGSVHSSASNHISINQTIELDFHRPTDEAVTINLVPDTDTAMAQVDMFVDAYNSLVDLSDAEAKMPIGSRNLYNDISVIVSKHKEELEAAGLAIDDNYHLVKNETLLADSVQSGEFSQLFNDISSFKDDVSSATNRLTLDPVAYINKLIVTYPNTSNKASTPYTQSLYSGLIYNNYA